MERCGGEGEEEKDGAKPIDPLLQLITLFSRSALTERRCVCVNYKTSHAVKTLFYFYYWSLEKSILVRSAIVFLLSVAEISIFLVSVV